MKRNTYKIKKVQLDNMATVLEVGKRCTTFTTTQHLSIGGLYFLKQDQLYRIEQLMVTQEV